jgi:ABC-2 type transport system permease protein
MSRLAEYAERRELVLNLTLRELRGKYKRSVLGWTWSLINPLATVAIYTIVFSVFLKIQPTKGHPSGLDSFPLFLLCALLPWNFFSGGLSGSMGALIANSNLVKKVYFPRELLVFSTMAALLVSFAVEMIVLVVVLLLVGNMVLPWLPMVAVLVAIETVLVAGVGLALSVFNVYFRDVEYLMGIVLQALFYSAPIVYPITFVPVEANFLGMTIPLRAIYKLNPLVHLVENFRAVLYDLRFPSFGSMCYLTGWAIASLVIGLWVFARFDRRLAEEL